MGRSVAAGYDGGPYRNTQKIIKAIFCTTDGQEFEALSRDISEDYDGMYEKYVKEYEDKLNHDKIITIYKNKKTIMLMVNYIKYVKFEVISQ